MSAPRPRSSGALLAAVLLAGCATAIAPPRAPVSEPARAALDRLIARWHAFSDLRALAEVELRRGGQRQRMTGVVLARAPGSVRFEVLSPFGQPLLLAAVHEGRLVAYSAVTNEAVVGEASADTTARLLRLPVEPHDLVAVLSGHAVPPADLRQVELLPADDTGLPSLALVGRSQTQRVWLDPATGLVHRLEISGSRGAAVVVFQRDERGAVQGFEASAGPGAVVPGNGYVNASVRYREIVTGAGVDPARFTLTLPKDAKIQPIR